MAVRKVQQEIDALSRLREAPAAEAAPELRKALTDRVNLIVAKAAKIAAGRKLAALIPDLLHAFDRQFETPQKRDPQCWAKNAIAQALLSLEYREPAPFVRGIRYVQMEPVWGGQEDTATTLRGICTLALAAGAGLPREDALKLMVYALTDAAVPVRLEAARGLAQIGGDQAALLLRLKARTGDAEPSVLGQVFDALLALERDAAVPFVAEFLQDAAESTLAEAALSLGSSRLETAVNALIAGWERIQLRETLRGLAVSRHDKALEYLFALIRGGRARHACAAIEALSVNREFEEIHRRAIHAAAGREPEIQAALSAAFPPPTPVR